MSCVPPAMVLRANLRRTGITRLEDASELRAGQTRIDARVMLAERAGAEHGDANGSWSFDCHGREFARRGAH